MPGSSPGMTMEFMQESKTCLKLPRCASASTSTTSRPCVTPAAGLRPDPVRAAQVAIEAGADGITAHLREDRRHIRDEDMARLKAEISKPLNFEMAATADMLRLSLATKPHAVCLVPERREELTTEGGLDVVGQHNALAPFITKLNDAGIRVSLFIAADERQIEMAARLRAPVIEIHTGAWCDAVDRRPQGQGGSRMAAHRRRRQAGAVGRPRGPCRPRPRLRHRRDHRGAARDRRAQHRLLHDRRSDLRRPRRDGADHARGDGPRAGRRA